MLTAAKPGGYVLAARHEGHVGVTYEPAAGQIGLTVKGTPTDPVVVRMTPFGTMSGKISWVNGDPVAHQRVMLSRFRTINGIQVLAPERELWTGKDGGYKAPAVPPGDYLVSAAVVQSVKMARPGHTNVPSWYPGVRDIQRARLVRVEAGRATADISMRIGGPVVGMRVSGVLVDSSGTPIAGAPISARRLLVGGALSLLSSDLEVTQSGKTGVFVFPALAQGRYALSASSAGKWNATAKIDVGVGNVKGLKLTALATARVEGRVVMERERESPGPRIVRIAIRSGGGAAPPREAVAAVAPDGTFSVSGVPAGAARFDVSLMSPRHYVKEIQLGGSDVNGHVVNLAGGESVTGVVVVVSPGAAELTGTVPGSEKARVVVFPSSSELWDSALHLVRTVSADASGAFVVRGLKPGDYQVVAVNGGMDLGGDPELLAKLQAVSRHLFLTGGRVQREVVPVFSGSLVGR